MTSGACLKGRLSQSLDTANDCVHAVVMGPRVTFDCSEFSSDTAVNVIVFYGCSAPRVLLSLAVFLPWSQLI